jgi:hypothetical protein
MWLFEKSWVKSFRGRGNLALPRKLTFKVKVKTLRYHANWLLRSKPCAAATPPKPCVATQTGPEGA